MCEIDSARNCSGKLVNSNYVSGHNKSFEWLAKPKFQIQVKYPDLLWVDRSCLGQHISYITWISTNSPTHFWSNCHSYLCVWSIAHDLVHWLQVQFLIGLLIWWDNPPVKKKSLLCGFIRENDQKSKDAKLQRMESVAINYLFSMVFSS